MLKAIVLLGPVVASLIWALLLLFRRKRHVAAKRFLGTFMLLAVLLYGSHTIYYYSLWHIYIYINGLYTFASLAAFPMFYVYVRLLTVDKKFQFRNHFKYLVIPVVFAVALSVVDVLMSYEEWLFYFTSVLIKGDVPNGIQKVAFGIYSLARVAFILQVVWYYFKGSRLVKEHNDQMVNFYSDLQTRGLNWLKNSNLILFSAALVGVLIAVKGREGFVDNTEVLFFPSFLVSCGIFIFGYLGSRQKSALIDYSDQFTNLSEVDVIDLQRRLLKLFEDDKIYLNKSLKIWEVSARLGVGECFVSQLFKERFKQDFSSFVNYYRIRYFKNELIQDRNTTLEILAVNSGFESVYTLNKTFYQKEGLSISEYMRLRDR